MKAKKLEKAVLLGVRETKETRKGLWRFFFRQTKATRIHSALGLLAWVPWLLKTWKDLKSKTHILYEGADQKCLSKCRLCASALGDAAL